MKIIKRKLMWTDVTVRKQCLHPTYYFDFDLLNEIGFQDEEMMNILEEMKTFAEKELNERKEGKDKREKS